MLPATAAAGGSKSSEPWRPMLRPVQSPRGSDPAGLMTQDWERAKGCKTLQCNPVPRPKFSSKMLQTNRLTSNYRPLNCYLLYGAWSTHQPAVPPEPAKGNPAR